MARPAAMFASLLIAGLVLVAFPRAAEAIGADSKWGPVCGQIQVEQSPQRWSNVKTWNLAGGGIPGVGALVGQRVVVPCNTTILLDVNITVELLDIQGTLRVLDAGPTVSYLVTANAIFVQGALLIGTSTSPFSSQITFFLANSPKNTIYQVTRPAIDGFSSPLSLDNKVFAIIGGRFHAFGFPGPANAPAWTRLATTAARGASTLVLQTSVEGLWPVGGQLMIASSDYDRNQTEVLTITAVSGRTVTVSTPLAWSHFGGTVPSGLGRFIDESTEVALLNRNIVIQGESDAADPLIGGHFIVFHTQHPQGQLIDGVQFVNLGQQGRLGRYSVHFHLCQDVRPTVVSRNSVVGSNQRCYVVHGTHWITLKGNVCYKNKGHGYLLEDGVESNNTWDGNLAALSEPVTRLISSGVNGAIESDDTPSNFWMTNPTNTFINNAAAGASDSGYWFQMSQTVLGPSAFFPEAAGVVPKELPLKLFKGNTAHSSNRNFKTYPSGFRAPLSPVSKIESFRAWKARFMGMFFHRSTNLVVDGAQLADNLIGIQLDLNTNLQVINSVIVGETENLGNPTCPNKTKWYDPCPDNYCPWTNCVPVSGCSMPVNVSTTAGRSTPTFRYRKSAGIIFTGYTGWTYWQKNHTEGSRVFNTQISRFPTACNVTRAAIIVTSYTPLDGDMQALGWTTAHSIKNITFDSVSVPVRFLPITEMVGRYQDISTDQGPMGAYLTLWDEDGSVTKKGPGFLVKDTPGFGASSATNTTAGGFAACEQSISVIGGLSCPKACYRTVYIYWQQPVVVPYNLTGSRAFRFTRTVDDAVVEVYHKVTGDTPPWHWAVVNLLALQTYRVDFLLRGSNGALPSTFYVGYLSEGVRTCDGGLSLMFAPPVGGQYKVFGALNKGKCAPNLLALDPLLTTHSYTCYRGKPYLQLSMESLQSRAVDLSVFPGRPKLCFNCPQPPRTPPPPPPPPSPPPPPAATTIGWAVGVNATVSIPIGTTVTFAWQDTTHSVNATNKAAISALGTGLGKGTQFQGPPYAVTVPFYSFGTYTFNCGVHGALMSATVIVV